MTEANKQELYAELQRLVGAAKDSLKEAELYATKHGLSFRFDLAETNTQFIGDAEEYKELNPYADTPTGWYSSYTMDY